MKAYYNLNTNELTVHRKEPIKEILINNEVIENVDESLTIKIESEKPENNEIKINGETVFIQYHKITGPKMSSLLTNKNLNGLNLIKITNNPYIKKYGLTGKGIKVGIVDGGAVYKHYEFSNGDRVKYQQTSSTDTHSTHVAGTIGAFGYDTKAKGVAGEVEIYSYTFDNHIASLTDCAKKGINSTNNSYGFTNGWENGNYFVGFTYEFYIANYKNGLMEEPAFGKYSAYSAQLDQITNKYPNFIMCFAAGNDRNDKYTSGNWFLPNNNGNWVPMNPLKYPPPKNDGDFDSVDTLACAKNVITVGATIDGSMTTTYFSAWGPTDDLRIKPDVVANGDSVYSTSNSGYKSYTTMSGTSMATPFATGSCAIIQQFIKDRLKYFPISSTTKACLIHGINNTSINGKNGYGLIDMENTLKYLELVLKKKASLYNNYVVTGDSKFSFNGTSLVATLCWTDKVGKPTTETDINSVNQAIINQLGLYVVNNGKYYYPFRLENKESDAVQKTSDSYDEGLLVKHDNVQKIIISGLSGTSSVYVKKIKTSSIQNFSLCLSLGF